MVGSKSKGNLTAGVNAKMLDTALTDEVTSNVLNEIQEIEIKSLIIGESYVSFFYLFIFIKVSIKTKFFTTKTIDYKNLAKGAGKSEMQQIKIYSVSQSQNGFRLKYDGAQTIPLTSSSTSNDIKQALNDLPTLYPNLVLDVVNVDAGSTDKAFTVKFSSDLGNLVFYLFKRCKIV